MKLKYNYFEIMPYGEMFLKALPYVDVINSRLLFLEYNIHLNNYDELAGWQHYKLVKL